MSVSIKGLTAFVTGASKGIGRAVALELAKNGCNVFAVARSEELLKSLVTECEAKEVKAAYCCADVTNHDQMDAAVKDCLVKFSAVNILVNNAGLAGLTTDSIEVWEAIITTNLTSLMRLTKTVLPVLEKEASAGRRAVIINIGSVSGVNKYGFIAPYCASKHGLNGFSGALFEAYRNKGIKVSVINPGWVDTGMTTKVRVKKEHKMDVQQVAHTVLFVATFPGPACPSEILLHPQYTE